MEDRITFSDQAVLVDIASNRQNRRTQMLREGNTIMWRIELDEQDGTYVYEVSKGRESKGFWASRPMAFAQWEFLANKV